MRLEIEVGDYTHDSSAVYTALMPDKSLDLQRWRYEGHPSGKKGLIGHGSIDGDPVAMTPFIPTQLKGGGFGYQAVDTIALERARGKGAFVRIGAATLQQAEQRGALCVYGFPNALAARGWYSKKMRWTPMGTAPFLFRPMRTGLFLRRLLGRSFLDIPIPSLGKGYRNAEMIQRFNNEVNRVWAGFSEGILASVDRNLDYLNWRLFDKPDTTYNVIGARENGEMGAFASSHLAQKHGGNVGYIMEALAHPEARHVLPGLINELVSAMDKPDVVFAWCFPHSPNYRAFRRAGFYPMPDRIRPIEINFGATGYDYPGNPYTKRENWYLSYLDSDTV